MKVLSDSKPKARKQHTCEFCYEKIEKGEVYSCNTIVYDDQIYDWKTHLKCNDISNKLSMYDYCEEGLDGDSFHEFIKEEFCNIWQKTDNDHYESKDFIIPPFKGQLDFVIEHHG